MNTTPSTPSTPADAPKASLASDAGHPLDVRVSKQDMWAYLAAKKHYAAAANLSHLISCRHSGFRLAKVRDDTIRLLADDADGLHNLAQLSATDDNGEATLSVQTYPVRGKGLSAADALYIFSYWMPSCAESVKLFNLEQPTNGGTAQ
jgi:hypothetical protein